MTKDVTKKTKTPKAPKTKALKNDAQVSPEGISQTRWGDGLHSGDPRWLSQG